MKLRGIVVPIACLFLTSCGSGEKVMPSGPVEITLQLNWFPEVEHGGYYAALVDGEYERRGLKVTIVPGGANVPVIQQVATGRVTFGVSNADDVLLGRAQEADVVGLLAPLQTSPRCVMVHGASGIESFDQLKDVKLAARSGAAWAQFLQKNLPLENVEFVPYSGSVAAFLLDPKLAQQAYVFSEPIVARKEGGDPRVLMVSDLGFNPYTSVLIATNDTIGNRPQVVADFVAASRAGWRSYLADPAKANQRIHEANPEMALDFLAAGVAAMKPLVQPEGLAEADIGTMTSERWRLLAAQLAKIGAIDELAAAYVDQAYKTDFVEGPLAKE